MRGRWDPVNEAIHTALSNITLADMQVALLPAFRNPPAQAPLQPRPSLASLHSAAE
jgi:hypothetical protein